jgi:alpha-maltose-1-phosphate synthase
LKPQKQVILSHSGKQHAYHVAKALKDLGYLKRFYTSSYVSNKFVQKIINKTGNQFWSRRYESGLHAPFVKANWRFELNEVIQRKLKKSASAIEQLVYNRDENFDRYMSTVLDREKAPLFWGFQGSSMLSLQKTKEKGGTAICELATAHVTYAQKILEEEMRLMPEWADTISNVVFPKQYQYRLEQEPLIADKVIAASAFTKLSLMDAGIAEQKIVTLPLGAQIQHIPFDSSFKKINDRPLRLLFAGTLTQRKGIAYLLEAMTRLKGKDVELHCIGHTFGGEAILKKYASHYTYHGAMSQQQLFASYQHFDALILPTIFEGFALVIIEALAAGLPVITTSHSIGPDVIKNDENGYIIPIRNVEALVTSIENLRHKQDDEFHTMRLNSHKAALNYSWKNYSLRLSDFLTSFTP